MKIPLSRFAAGVLLALCVAACGSTPPKPVLPDGSHRVPVNVTPPVVPTAAPARTPGAQS